jgi:hypothetical protein
MGKPAGALDAHALTETMAACCNARQYLAAYRMYRLAFDTRVAYVPCPMVHAGRHERIVVSIVHLVEHRLEEPLLPVEQYHTLRWDFCGARNPSK